MKSFFKDNIAIIKKTNPSLCSAISRLESTGRITDVVAGNSYVPLVELNNKKIYVHSRFDPVKEAERLISQINQADFDLFIIFGFGYGYHVEELIKRISNDSIVLILEKDTEMLKNAITARDLKFVFSDERVFIIADPDEEKIAEALSGKSSYRVSFITHRGSYQIYPDYYSNLIRIVQSYLSLKEVNIATLSRFEKTWTANIARNIREFAGLPGANIFYNKFKGLPSIVAGAGPSLNKSIDFIKNNQNKCLIICVDTSYLILRNSGIIPHFCVSVDAQIINARYFEGDVRCDTVFISDPTVHPSVFRFIKGNIAILGTAFDMMKWIEDITGNKGELAYGGSVMTNAYDFAKRLGTSPVVLVGQDLAFTGGLAHARGAYLDEEIFLRQNRFYNPEMKNRFQLTALPKIRVNGILSKEVYTNQKLMVFLNWFEKRNDPELVNATFDGAYIKGIKHLPANEITFPELSNDIFNIIRSIYQNNKTDLKDFDSISTSLYNKCTGMKKELNSLIKNLERAVSLSADLMNIVKENKKSNKLDYILNKLSETDRILNSKNTIKEMIGFTVQRVIHTITEGYEIDANDSKSGKEELAAKRSHFLYKGILEGSLFNLRILDKMIKLLSLPG
jgi:hypothetical protein